MAGRKDVLQVIPADAKERKTKFLGAYTTDWIHDRLGLAALMSGSTRSRVINEAMEGFFDDGLTLDMIADDVVELAVTQWPKRKKGCKNDPEIYINRVMDKIESLNLTPETFTAINDKLKKAFIE